MLGLAIWITGLPGSGKSTISDKIKDIYPNFIILRMDEFRKIVTPQPTYSDSEREIVYRAFVYVAKILTELGYDVILDATGNMRRWRELARSLIPRFIEIYLKCPLDVCIERERLRKETHEAPKEIYKKGEKGWPVPGVVVPYEEPLNAEITIDTEEFSLNETLEIIKRELSRLKI